MSLKRLVATAALGLATLTMAANRVGPVSQYGQLQAGKSGSGQGRIFGSCSAYSSTPVQVEGMSMYWSLLEDNTNSYWNASTVNSFVSSYGMEIVRAAIGVEQDWGVGNYFDNTDYFEGKIDAVVNAAIANDIYVIIDYHSHCAETHTSDAVSFFSHMAQKWGSYDNVIFEIYNEPIGVTGTIYCDGMHDGQTLQTPSTYWRNAVRPYANQVISAIRKYSDNLIVVGTPQWDQHPEVAINYPVTDSKNNTAYTMHYYAGTHASSGSGSVGANTVQAINAGVPVFVTEWGTSAADGDTYGGTTKNDTWRSFIKTHKLSTANWSIASLKEGSAFYDQYGRVSQSGQYVIDNVLPGKKSYTACSGGSVTPTYSSSSVKPSSSASTPIIVDGDDILQGKGMFAGCSSLLGCGWTTNIKKFTNYTTGYTGNIELQENDDGDQVLGFWTNNRPIEEWELQVTHNVTLPMGYAYQIVGGGYMYEGTYGDVAIGVVTGSKSDEFVFGFSEELDGYFESDVYENCDADISGKFYINAGGLTGTQALTTGGYGGGMAIQEVKVLATPINCGGSINTSSSTRSSSSSAKSSSSTAKSSSSTTIASGADVIDDLEDGDNIPYTSGFWMAYTDNGSIDDYGESPESSIGNPIEGDDGFGNTIYQVVFPSMNTSNYVAGLKGINLEAGFYMYDPYVDLVLELNSDGAYDLSSCTSIKYDYKGTGHNFEVVMYNDYDGSATKYNYHKTKKTASPSWTTATISWTNLVQETGWGTKATLSKAKVGRFVWEVKDDTYSYLYVDNVRCVGATINKNVSSSSSAKSSSSSAKSSSSSAKSSSSSAKSSSSSAKSSSSISSSSTTSSSSSVKNAEDGIWVAENATVSNNTEEMVVIGAVVGTGVRKVSRTLETKSGSSYKMTFDVTATEADVVVNVRLNDAEGNNLCKDFLNLSTSSTQFKCEFEAASEEAVLSVIVSVGEGMVVVNHFKMVEEDPEHIVQGVQYRGNYNITRSADALQITSTNGKSFKVEMFDVMGNLMTKKLSAGSTRILLNDVQRGSYLLRISGKNGVVSTKINVK